LTCLFFPFLFFLYLPVCSCRTFQVFCIMCTICFSRIVFLSMRINFHFKLDFAQYLSSVLTICSGSFCIQVATYSLLKNKFSFFFVLLFILTYNHECVLNRLIDCVN
jgi:hypothetical protein